jgi:hypothetical protein
MCQLNSVYTFFAVAASTKQDESSHSGHTPIQFYEKPAFVPPEIACCCFPTLEPVIESIC